jgi:iron complex transport system permease protein
MAYVFSMLAAAVIIAVSKVRGATPEVMVLTGVALGALFTAGTMLLQYFADDVQLAAMVFWTFGDIARASWSDLGLLATVTGCGCAYLMITMPLTPATKRPRASAYAWRACG